MLGTLLRPFKSWGRRATARFRRNVEIIDEALWYKATQNYIFMRGLTVEENRRLRYIASEFLSEKTIIGAAELIISPVMRIQIAAQAAILVLELGTQHYAGWRDIIVYPGRFVPTREVMDEAGVVHTTQDPLAGEAWLGGPVVLSYEDVAMVGDIDNGVAGYNVVIHEFAHKLDMQNGDANGFPPLHRGMRSADWQQAFTSAYLDFCQRVDAADRHGGAAIDALPIDPYASESPAEFFAVLSEAFFELPAVVNTIYPKVYAQLRAFYRQDPLARLAAR